MKSTNKVENNGMWNQRYIAEGISTKLQVN